MRLFHRDPTGPNKDATCVRSASLLLYGPVELTSSIQLNSTLTPRTHAVRMSGSDHVQLCGDDTRGRGVTRIAECPRWVPASRYVPSRRGDVENRTIGQNWVDDDAHVRIRAHHHGDRASSPAGPCPSDSLSAVGWTRWVVGGLDVNLGEA
jgi:hypothetical protein